MTVDSPPRPPRPDTRPATRGTWALRDRPAVVWLALAVLLTLVHPFVPGSRWLMVHLVLLGALTHSALVWSTHFTQALLKTPSTLDDRRMQSIRLSLNIIGVLLVLIGVPTSTWPVTLVGAVLVSGAVLWHGVMLHRRLRHSLPGRFRITVRYYLAAAALLPVGAGFGAFLARGLDDDLHGRLLLAHTMTMLLGWIGLTVTGTLITLWPTMLRTRMDVRAEALARQALPVLLAGITIVVAGASLGIRPVAAAGVLAYAAGLGWWGRALWRPARQAPPRHTSTWSVTAALVWGMAALAAVVGTVLAAGSWTEVGESYGRVTTIAVIGFAAQLLTGALSHLVPAVLGGGPSVVRAATAWFDRGGLWRLVVVNGGLLICLAPVPGVVRVIVSSLVLAALAMFIPLMFRAIREAVRARRELEASVEAATAAATKPPRIGPEPGIFAPGRLVAGIATLLLAVSIGVAVDPSAAGLVTAGGTGTSAPADPKAPFAGSGAIAPTGATTTVRVEARDMSFSPSTVSVPAGNRLVIELVNVDTKSPHDLAFSGALKTERIMPGKSATIDVGVVTTSGEGWCTIVGHRQMGMVLEIVAEGGEAPGTTAASGTNTGTSAKIPGPTAATGNDAGMRLGQKASADFRAVDATLPPLTTPAGTVHTLTLTVEEVVLEVSPGVWQKRWTYNGQVPAPTLHGRVGDTFEVTLVNHGSMGHSIDFHAGERAPDEVMRTVPPGGTLTYRFTASRAGIWMYHCSTMPMSAHIAAGMHGAVVIEPDGLAPVARSYVLEQSEVYAAPGASARAEASEVDADKAAANTPDAVTFNGIANQYDARPLTARVGERVRIWVLAAGPNRGSDFHVVGGQFDTVWSEGGYLLRAGTDAFGSTGGGAQVLSLGAAQGGFIELTLTEPGNYPFVTHAMADAEKGAHGILEVR